MTVLTCVCFFGEPLPPTSSADVINGNPFIHQSLARSFPPSFAPEQYYLFSLDCLSLSRCLPSVKRGRRAFYSPPPSFRFLFPVSSPNLGHGKSTQVSWVMDDKDQPYLISLIHQSLFSGELRGSRCLELWTVNKHSRL